MVGLGVFKQIIVTLALGLFAIVLTLKDEKINPGLALGLLIVFYMPTIPWLFKAEVFGFDNIKSIVIMVLQIVIGYFVGQLIFKKKILYHKRKDNL